MAVRQHQNRKTINFTTIHKRITEQGKTIPEIAIEYGMTLENLVDEMQRGLGPKVYPVLKRASEKNQKARERMRHSAALRAQKSEQEPSPVTIEQGKTNTEGNFEEIPSRPEEQTKTAYQATTSFIKELEIKRAGIETTLAELHTSLEEMTRQCGEKLAEVQTAEKKLEETKCALEKARNDYSVAEQEYASTLERYKILDGQLSDIDAEILKLRQEEVFLVAPGYHGELPCFGKLVSSEEVEGANVEVKSGELLLNPESLTNMVECGYYDLREYMRALEFAKLCIAFALGNSAFHILVDDTKITKVLETQEIGI